jgi:prophage DNA circulation protein
MKWRAIGIDLTVIDAEEAASGRSASGRYWRALAEIRAHLGAAPVEALPRTRWTVSIIPARGVFARDLARCGIARQRIVGRDGGIAFFDLQILITVAAACASAVDAGVARASVAVVALLGRLVDAAIAAVRAHLAKMSVADLALARVTVRRIVARDALMVMACSEPWSSAVRVVHALDTTSASVADSCRAGRVRRQIVEAARTSAAHALAALT